ncbi:MAG TPA: phosphoribosylglycinamide formyltransferase [Candidatus Omnitrophota bacterium]|nr:phosphoribosylglycinamide formyltransferase [Candidatus Omnitrophota bacterium]
MKNIAVFVSGNGTNLQAIIDSIKKGVLKVNLVLVISDNKSAFALERARKAQVKALYINPKDFSSKQDFEKDILKNLEKEKVDLVVLAGFMRILSPYFVASYKNRIINIHPALLPAFKGAHAIKDAFEAKVRETGVIVHFVDEEVDHGPIIAQGIVKILKDDTLESLEDRIHKLEHELYPKAIELVTTRQFEVKGDKAVFKRG